MASTKIGNLSGELAKQFKIYSNEIADEVNVKSLELAKSAVRKLKETSPKIEGSATNKCPFLGEIAIIKVRFDIKLSK